jgi:S-phase kinase-associated protein 1
MASLDIEEVQNEIIIVTNDGISHTVKKNIISMSNTIKTILEGDTSTNQIELDKISSRILKLIIDYCTYHFDKPAKLIEKPLRDDFDKVICSWDSNFLKPFSKEILFEMVNIADYLNISDLFELLCAKVAALLKGKSTEEMRKILEINSDLDQADENEAIKKNKILTNCSSSSETSSSSSYL